LGARLVLRERLGWWGGGSKFESHGWTCTQFTVKPDV